MLCVCARDEAPAWSDSHMHRRGFNWSDCKSASADATGSASRSVEEQCFSTPASSLVSVVACLVRRSGSWEGIRYSVPHGVGRWDRMEASEAGRPCGVVCRVPPLLGVDSLSAGGRGGGLCFWPGGEEMRKASDGMHALGRATNRETRTTQANAQAYSPCRRRHSGGDGWLALLLFWLEGRPMHGYISAKAAPKPMS